MSDSVLMVAEGSYPYVIGGVGTWMHSILNGLKQQSFELLNIGEFLGGPTYQILKNVTSSDTLALKARYQRRPLFPKKTASKTLVSDVLSLFMMPAPEHRIGSIIRILIYALENTDNGYARLAFSNGLMSMMVEKAKESTSPSLPALSYTIRETLSHFFTCANSVKSKAPMSMVHSTTTGLAGLYSLAYSIHHNRPLLLTEHADYVAEKRFYETQLHSELNDKRSDALEKRTLELKLNFLENLRSTLYSHCIRATSLFDEYRLKQIGLGANPSKCVVVPNGVASIQPPLPNKDKGSEVTIGFFGRISPEKGIDNIILAFHRFQKNRTRSRCIIAGPSNDSSFASKCKRLVQTLGLDESVTFEQAMPKDVFYSRVDVLLLASISEGQPYVILEAMARNIPVVCTDVGHCRRMLQHQTSDGSFHAGIAVDDNSPQKLSKALETIVSTKDFTRSAGPQIVNKSFNIAHTIKSFRTLYNVRSN